MHEDTFIILQGFNINIDNYYEDKADIRLT